MSVNPYNVSSKEFEVAAQRNANAFWFWLIITIIIYALLNWWAIIPAFISVFCAIASVSATRRANYLQKVTPSNSNNNISDH